MNFHDWILDDPMSLSRRAVINLLLPIFRYFPPFTGRTSNALMCERFVSSMPTIGPAKTIYGLRNIADQAKNLAAMMAFKTILLGGNLEEQREFTQRFNPPNLVVLEPSTNTPEQIEKVIQHQMATKNRDVMILAHETICTRAVLTFIRQVANDPSVWMTKVFPFPFIEPNRSKMDPKLRELITIYEAFRLTRYQRKGHVATIEQAFKWLPYFEIIPFSGADTLCIIY